MYVCCIAWTDFTRLPRSSWMPASSLSPSLSASALPLSASVSAPFATSLNSPFNSSSSSGQTGGLGHGGSRKRLLFARQEALRISCGERQREILDRTLSKMPPTRIVNLISDVSKENS